MKLEPFLEHVLIRENGIYTLLGIKPITLFDISSSSLTEEEKIELYHSYPEDIKKKASFKKMNFASHNCQVMWKDWKTFAPNIERNFAFFSRHIGFSETGVFINVLSVSFLLNEYRSDFIKGTGIDFDPLAILSEISDESSLFWNSVFKNHYLTGLLLGYGKKNSLLFEWMIEKKIQPQAVLISKQNIANQGKAHLRIQDISIPSFQSFSILDEKRLEYEKARKEIIKFYRKKDFFLTSMRILTRSQEIIQISYE